MVSHTRKLRTSVRRNIRSALQKIPTVRSLTRKNCPPGMILRKGYTRKYSTAVRQRGFSVRRKNDTRYHVNPRAKDMFIQAACIKNVGKPNKGPKLFGPLKKGELAKHGYSFRRGEAERRAALKRALDEYGPLGVFRKLNAVEKLTKRAAPAASSVFRKDRNWVRSSFGTLKRK